MNIFSEILVLSALVSVACAILGLKRKQTKSGFYFSLLMFASAVYSFGYAFQLDSHRLMSMILWTKIQYFGISFIPYFWFLFALYFTGYDRKLSPRVNLFLLGLPIITLFLVLTLEKHSFFYSSLSIVKDIPLGVLKIGRGIWYWVFQVYSYSLILIGGMMFLSTYYKSSRPYRQQAVIALVGSVIPLFTYSIYLLGFSPYSIDLIPFAISISGIIYFYALANTEFLKLIPVSRDRVFENMMNSVFVFDKDNHLVDFNPRAKHNFDFINEDLIGQHVRDIFAGHDYIVDNIINIDKNEKVFDGNLYLEDKVFAAMFSVATDNRDRVTGKLLILNDITKLIDIENKLRQNSENLKELIADKDRFFSIIAHDLRGPFQGFLGLSGILVGEIETLTPEEIKDLALELNLALKTQYNFLEELLQWAGLNTNKVSLNLTKLNIGEVINSAVEVLSNNATAKNISIKINGDNDVWFTADKDMLKLVVRNLLSNAIKFSFPDSIITISILNDNDYVSVEVKDQGVGISEVNLEKLFGTQSHYTSNGTAKERGSGLGLILCKEILDKHNGKIWVESEIGKGSKFTFKLPKRNL